MRSLTRLNALLTVGLSLSGTIVFADSKPVAIVTAVSGPVSVMGTDKAGKNAELFQWLNEGSNVETGTAGKLTLAFANGKRYELGQNVKVTLAQSGMTPVSGKIRELSAVPPLPKISAVTAGGEQQRPAAFRLRGRKLGGIYPNGNVTMADATVLRFSAVPEARKYKIDIEDEEGSTLFEAETEKPELAVSPGVLKPGQHYFWKVKTIEVIGSAARGEGEFTTLTAEQARSRESLRQSIEKSGEGSALALLAEVDRSLGLLHEAAHGFEMALAKGADPALQQALDRTRAMMKSDE